MTTNFTSSLTSVFNLPDSDSRLADLVRVAPVPFAEVHALEPFEAARSLAIRLGQIFRASPQDLRFIRAICGRSRAYLQAMYPTREVYIAGAMGNLPSAAEPPIICLTGHPGVGKSGLQRAVERLTAGKRLIHASESLPPYMSHPVARFEPKDKVGKSQILDKLMQSVGVEQDYTGHRGKVSENVRLNLYQRGCAHILGDEIQFTSYSTTANAQAASLLMLLWYTGIPATYACNYSLGHRLKTRPPEDQTRLLDSPMVMFAEAPDSAWFASYLQDIGVVLNGCLKIDPLQDAREIHEMTFGLKRSIIKLVCAAYRVARDNSNGRRQAPSAVTMDHFRRAFNDSSYGYDSDRVIVQQCWRALIGLDVEKHYLCPFKLELSDTERQKKLASDSRDKTLATAQLLAAQPRSERAPASPQRAAASSAVTKPPKPMPAPRRPKTAEEMRVNLRALGISPDR